MTISRLGFKFGTMVISKLVNVRKGARKCDPRHILFLNFRAPSVRAPRYSVPPGYQKPTGALHRYHKTARFFELNEMVVQYHKKNFFSRTAEIFEIFRVANRAHSRGGFLSEFRAESCLLRHVLHGHDHLLSDGLKTALIFRHK